MKRVLVFPHKFRIKYFCNLLEHAVSTGKWQVAVICSYQDRKIYEDIIGDNGVLFYIPNFRVCDSWELNDGERKKIHYLIEDCETKSQISVNRVLLAADRELGRAYSKEFFYWNESALAKQILKKPDVAHEIIERIFHFCSDKFENFNPDMVVGGATGSPISYTLSLISENLGIPFLVNRRSKIHSKHCLWILDRAMLSDLTRHEFKRRESEGTPISDEARVYIARFEESPKTVDYIKNWWQRAAQSKRFWPWHRQVLRMAIAQTVHVIKRRKGHPPDSAWLKFIEFYRMAYLRFRHRGMMEKFTEEQLKSMKYIYLPFHKEPEMAINVQAYPWHSQKETVKFLSTLLPHGYKLLVREHRGTWGTSANSVL